MTKVIDVHGLGGLCVRVAWEADWDASRLKSAIEREINVPVSLQQLLMNDTEIEDEASLTNLLSSDASLQDTLHVTMIRRSPIEEAVLDMLGMNNEFRKAWQESMMPESMPHESRCKLIEIAQDVAFRIAATAAWFGGPGHLEGYPTLKWKETWGKLKPQSFAAMAHGMQVSEGTRILPGSCRVIVRVKETAQKLMEEAGRAPIDEISANKDEGWWIVGDIIHLRASFPPEDALAVIRKRLRDRYPQSEFQRHMSLVSRSLEELVFEMSFRAMEEDEYGDGCAQELGSV